MHINVEEKIIYPIEVTNEEDWVGWVNEDNVQEQEEHSKDVVQLNESNAQEDEGALKESEEKIGSQIQESNAANDVEFIEFIIPEISQVGCQKFQVLQVLQIIKAQFQLCLFLYLMLDYFKIRGRVLSNKKNMECYMPLAYLWIVLIHKGMIRG